MTPGDGPSIQLVHWHADEAEERASLLRAAGFAAVCGPYDGSEMWQRIRAQPPAALVVDLSRLPALGQQVGLVLRETKATRTIPLVFVGGEPAKVAKTRELLPDAGYATWDDLAAVLAAALASPPRDPIDAGGVMAGYSGTPLPKKLGIKAGMRVALFAPPADFADTLGALPAGVELAIDPRGPSELSLAFLRSAAELKRRLPALAKRAAAAPLWLAWPKKGSLLASDVTEPLVRAAGLAAGLVDYKVCALDSTWAGLLFRKRKEPAGTG